MSVKTGHTAQHSDDSFNEWLRRQVGYWKWIVARDSKKRREAGYDRFFTQERFAALWQAFQKETTQMNSFSQHLTEPNPDLAAKIRGTPPGMAHWAGTGPAGKTCRECSKWHMNGYLVTSGLLKDSYCDKYTSMMNGNLGGKVPYYIPAYKYFDPAAKNHPIENPHA